MKEYKCTTITQTLVQQETSFQPEYVAYVTEYWNMKRKNYGTTNNRIKFFKTNLKLLYETRNDQTN